jgi:hypothetical protein
VENLESIIFQMNNNFVGLESLIRLLCSFGYLFGVQTSFGVFMGVEVSHVVIVLLDIYYVSESLLCLYIGFRFRNNGRRSS